MIDNARPLETLEALETLETLGLWERERELRE